MLNRSSHSLTLALLSSTIFFSANVRADTTINGAVAVQQQTALAPTTPGNITISSTGSVTVGGTVPAVLVNTSNTLTVNDNNAQASAIKVTTVPVGTMGAAVEITATNGAVTLGTNLTGKLSIDGTIAGSRGVGLGATGANLNNSGAISSDQEAVFLSTLGTNAIVSNAGSITSASSHGISINPTTFSSISNLTGGTITANAGAGIFSSVTTAGTITNAGTITGNNALLLNTTSNFTGTITNTGSMTSTTDRAVRIQGLGTITLNNQGTITTTTAGNAGIRQDTSAVTLNITNASSATITGAANGVVFTGAGATDSLTNSGVITGTTNAGVITQAGLTASVTNNSGAYLVGGVAGVLSSGAGSNLTLVNAGTIGTNAGNTINSQYGVNNTTSTVENITNTGTIIGTDAGINIGASSSGSITNSSGGIITATGNASKTGIVVTTGTFTGSISNAGTISATGTTSDGVKIGSAGTLLGDLSSSGSITGTRYGLFIDGILTGNISNSGTITGPTHGIHLDGTLTGNISNSGTITSSAGAGINLQSGSTFSGKISNDTGGTITGATNGVSLNINTTGDLKNAGSIKTTGTGSAIALPAGITLTGSINNSGTLSNELAGSGPVLDLSGVVTGTLTNSGTITSISNTKAPIYLPATGKITGGIVNSGNITSSVTNAVDLTLAAEAVPFTHTAGTITGNIQGANGFANTILMSGGSLIGSIIGGNGVTNSITTSSGTITGSITGGTGGTNTISVSDTTIMGAITGGVGGTNTITMTNTKVSGAVTLKNAADSVTLSGGSIGGILEGVAGSKLTVSNTFTTTNVIDNFKTLDVKAGTFTVGANITNLNAAGEFKVANGATLISNASITAAGALTTLDNKGTIQLNNASAFNFNASTMTNTGTISLASSAAMTVGSLAGTGSLAFQIIDVNNYPHITSTNADVLNDTVTLSLAGQNVVRVGDLFTVINNTNPIANLGTITLVQPSSLIVSFTQVTTDNTKLSFSASRVPFSNIAQTQNAKNVGAALDELLTFPAVDPTIATYLGYVDVMQTAADVNASLLSLTPLVDNGLTQTSQEIQNIVLDVVSGRMGEARNVNELFMASGDEFFYGFGAWVKAYGSVLSQKDIEGFSGYSANFGGVTFGFDKLLDRYLGVGGALSYITGAVDDNQTTNSVDLTSFQFTAYTTYDPKAAWYADGMASLGLNTYTSQRTITAGANFVLPAFARFQAWQYALRGEAGYNLVYYGRYRVTPLAMLTFGNLERDAYTETGAGGLSLSVTPAGATELVTSVGLKFSTVNKYQEATYVPEFRAMVSYDFLKDTEQDSSFFVGSGNVLFETQGLQPSQLSYDLGVGLTVHSNDKVQFTMYYDIEFKEQFIGNTGYIKAKYIW